MRRPQSITPKRVSRVSDCELRVTGTEWPFARQHRDAIEAHWIKSTARNPKYFNGIIHVLASGTVSDGRFAGELTRTEFKNFLYWRDQGQPQAGVRDAFGSGLVRSADGHVVLGQQRPGHINSGLVYLPGGFIDERDVTPTGLVDIAASIGRELAEETGLDSATLERLPGYLMIEAGPQCLSLPNSAPHSTPRRCASRCSPSSPPIPIPSLSTSSSSVGPRT